MRNTHKTDTISASKLKTSTLDNKAAQRIKVYEFDNKLGCYTEKLANLTEGQSYMAVEFKKMQEEMKSLKEYVYLLQTNLEYRRKVNGELSPISDFYHKHFQVIATIMIIIVIALFCNLLRLINQI